MIIRTTLYIIKALHDDPIYMLEYECTLDCCQAMGLRILSVFK